MAEGRSKLQDVFVSIVLVLRPESTGADKYIKKVFSVLKDTYTDFEIIVVDNGADDEFMSVARLLDTIPCIRLIRLSRQYKYDTALFAGLDVSIGDFVCTLDMSIDAPSSIPKIVTLSKKHDVVQGVSELPIKSVFGNQIGRRLFYWYNKKYLGIDIPLNATYHASYTRRAINSLTGNSGRYHRHVRHMARRIGYGYTVYLYTPTNNPSNQRKLKTGIIEALEIVTSYSTHPLRFVTWLGVIAGTLNVVYAFYVLVLNFLQRDLAPGWTSTSMQLSLMFFILFMILIILAEYIGRILLETHREPGYLIADELNSTEQIADNKRRNITK